MLKYQNFRQVVVLVAFPVLLFSNARSGAQQLSEEGRGQRATHNYLLNTFLDGRKTKFQGQGETKALKELILFEKTMKVRDGFELALPDGAERIARMFRHFGFNGANLDRIHEVRVFPFSLSSMRTFWSLTFKAKQHDRD